MLFRINTNLCLAGRYNYLKNLLWLCCMEAFMLNRQSDDPFSRKIKMFSVGKY